MHIKRSFQLLHCLHNRGSRTGEIETLKLCCFRSEYLARVQPQLCLLHYQMLQFLIGAGLAGIRQADDGQAAGTLPDQLGQDTGQFDAFEDGAACVDAHRDAVTAEGDRRTASGVILG